MTIILNSMKASVVPVEGSTEAHTPLAQKIHAYCLDEHHRTGEPVPVRDLYHMFGRKHTVMKHLVFGGTPLEDLIDDSLMYQHQEPVEGEQP